MTKLSSKASKWCCNRFQKLYFGVLFFYFKVISGVCWFRWCCCHYFLKAFPFTVQTFLLFLVLFHWEWNYHPVVGFPWSTNAGYRCCSTTSSCNSPKGAGKTWTGHRSTQHCWAGKLDIIYIREQKGIKYCKNIET